MAFVSFGQVPNHAPIAIRATNPVPPARPRFPFHRLGKWLTGMAAMVLIGERVAAALDSAALGVAGAGLAFVFAVALGSVTRPAPRGRYR
jgi:hypothetical protein